MEFTAESIRQFIDALPEHYMAIVCNGEGELETLAFSAGILRLVGVTEEEFTSGERQEMFYWILPEDRQLVTDKYREGFQKREGFEYTYRLVHKMRGSSWVHSRVSFPGTVNGQAFCLSSLAPMAMETEASAAAREHLDAVMRMDPDAMSTFRMNVTKDTLYDGVSSYPNLRMLQNKGSLSGYVEDALQYLPFEGEREQFASQFGRAHLLSEFEAGHTRVSMTHHYMLRDREQKVLETIVSMARNRLTGDVEGIVYTLDVTKNTYYSKINEVVFGNFRRGIVVINVKKGTFLVPQDSAVLPFSTSFEEQDYEEGVRQIVEQNVVEEGREAYLRCARLPYIVECLERSGSYSFSSIWKKDGELCDMRLTCRYLDETREQIIGLVEDVTEITRKEQEQVERYRSALQKAEEAVRDKNLALEEARRANHAKSDFLSSMSHDIRTPLNAILNLTRLLWEELDAPEKLRQDIQKMEVAGEFLLQLINDILDVSAIESGRLELHPGVYTYATFLNYIKGIIEPLCVDKDITFLLEEGPTALDIYMDRVRFHQVFFNILSNAVKYTPPGGIISFQTTNNVVHDGILTCDFIVTDTGCGMSREFIQHAFEPFVREDQASAYVGTGLGLSICRKIVDMMGGTITIESELGKGTKVTVHMDLMIATEEQRAASKAELDTSYHRNVFVRKTGECRILVAEDNEINSEILARLLAKKGYLVERVENGARAVSEIENHDGGYYHVVLMDIRMPVMDGLQATALIRRNEEEKKRHIPIIAITANAFEEDARQCLAAGMNACLSKPIVPAELYQMVATYLQVEE